MNEVTNLINKTEEGDKIVALIRHVNTGLELESRIVHLINDGDGWNFLDLDMNRTHEKLSFNWDIIDFRKLNLKK